MNPIEAKLASVEAKLASVLLRLAADEFSCHGCNDFDLFEHMTPDEALTLQRAMYAWNGDPENAPNSPEGARWAQDNFIMAYLAARLRDA